MGRLRIPALAATLLLLAVPAASQVARGRAANASPVVEGQVVDDRGGTPLVSVNVALVDAGGVTVAHTTTDEAGVFTLQVPREGSYRVAARHIGFQPYTEELGPLGGQVSLKLPPIRLRAGVVEMDALVITAEARRPRSPRLVSAGFHERCGARRAACVTREEILRDNPGLMSVVVRRLPGVRYAPAALSAGGGDVVLARGGSCLPSIWIDGGQARPGGHRPGELPPGMPAPLPMAHGQSLDELVNPNEVEGVEVYRNALDVPAGFAGSSPACGALVFWLRGAPLRDDVQAAMAGGGRS